MRPLTIAGLGFAALALLGVILWLIYAAEPPVDRVAPAASRPEAALPEPPPPSALALPAFDIVRVSRDGTTVVAGQGPANTEILIVEGDTVLGRVTTDRYGEWATVLDDPLPPGSRELSLQAVGPEGEELESGSVVVVLVPERDEDRDATALLTPRSGEGPSRVLQGLVAPEGELGLNVVDYDQDGAVSMSGSAPPGERLRIYVDDGLIGDATADEEGRWVLEPDSLVLPGAHKLRVDQLAAGDQVVARIEVPFERAEIPGLSFEAGSVVVLPGNSLWRVARRVYGAGARYSLIYEANKDQIRNPDLIYPGQVFRLPEPGAEESPGS